MRLIGGPVSGPPERRARSRMVAEADAGRTIDEPANR
jgi:hypothetical protein